MKDPREPLTNSKDSVPKPDANSATNVAQEAIIVGRLGAPHGLRGEVHIHSYTTPADNILNYQPWFFRKRPQGRKGSKRGSVHEGDSGWQKLAVSDLRAHKDHFLGRVQGYVEREEVALLKGMEVGVPRGQLPDLQTDEFYWRDLISAQVIDTNDVVLGKVAGLIETGAHDVLRVRPPESGQSEVLIPFVKTYILSVSTDEIRVDWDPAWLG